jgi:uncharacterized protein YbjQ (UPF0145 family)
LSNNKRDLTRIEDLGEYIHELNQDDEDTSSQEEQALVENESDVFDSSAFGTDNQEGESDPNFETSEFTNFETDSSEEAGSFPESNFGSSPFEESEPLNSQITSSESFEGEDPFFPADEPPTFEPQEATEIISISETNLDYQEEISEEVAPSNFQTYTPQESFHTSENFQDLKKFAENSSLSGMATEGNPSFSLLIKQVRYIEDVNDIIILLKELKLLQDPEEKIKARLSRGTLLVPRISEFAAIFLAHKLRRLDIDIQVGPSDEIHPPKYQEDAEIGVVSKNNLYQNQNHHFHFSDQKLDLNQIIISAIPQLEGYQVIKYIGVASEHKVLESKIVEKEDSSEVPTLYSDLAQKLKAHALKSNANAVVGINYQLTPIPSEYGLSGHKYRLTCTGNLVWVQKI